MFWEDLSFLVHILEIHISLIDRIVPNSSDLTSYIVVTMTFVTSLTTIIVLMFCGYYETLRDGESSERSFLSPEL